MQCRRQHTHAAVPHSCRAAEGEWVKKEGTKFSSLLHNPRERQDLDITANWQRTLRSRFDLPLPLKFIFQPLCFGKFHQVLDRAVIREAGYDCSCTKSPHLKNEMMHSQTAAKWPIISLSVVRSYIFGQNDTFLPSALSRWVVPDLDSNGWIVIVSAPLCGFGDHCRSMCALEWSHGSLRALGDAVGWNLDLYLKTKLLRWLTATVCSKPNCRNCRQSPAAMICLFELPVLFLCLNLCFLQCSSLLSCR